jgi:hypothetical protein
VALAQALRDGPARPMREVVNGIFYVMRRQRVCRQPKGSFIGRRCYVLV